MSSIYIQEFERYAIDIAYGGNITSYTSDDVIIPFISFSNPVGEGYEHWLKNLKRWQKSEKITSQIIFATFYYRKRKR